MAKLRVVKAPGICNVSVKLLQAGGEAMICRLHVVLTAVCSLISFLTGRGVGLPYLERERGLP